MALNELLEEYHVRKICLEMIKYLIPLWVAFCVGLVLGWIWKPNRASSDRDKSASSSSAADLSSPCSSSSSPSNGSKGSSLAAEFDVSSKLQLNEDQSNIVTMEDFAHLRKLVVMKDGGPPWIQMMDRSTQTMSYQAWRRDPKNGPPQYRSRTVFDDAAPEIVRDFFWDDSFRSKWDDMLAHSTIIEECPTTGTMVVHWIRKFPFFCSDREYIIGRRIWESGRSFYCVTKGVPCESVPRRDKPRRVDMYYSSWCIRAVESQRCNGQLTACEVLLFHHEDMGIPWEIAKLGIRQGMWGAVRKIEPGLRAYQKERASGTPLSQSALMAQINTKIDPEHLRTLRGAGDLSETEVAAKSDKALGGNIPKLLIFSGAIIIACNLNQGFLPKAFIFGVARRFANMGKKL